MRCRLPSLVSDVCKAVNKRLLWQSAILDRYLLYSVLKAIHSLAMEQSGTNHTNEGENALNMWTPETNR